MSAVRSSILSRRLVALRPVNSRFPSKVLIRYASSAQQVSGTDVASFHSFLDSHPNEAQIDAFKNTRKYKDVVNYLKSEGATQEEIDDMTQPVVDDPGMTGGYVNPEEQKRSLRDPYEDWWDKQERRNYGEPVHEDNDILGVFSLEEYNQWAPGKAARWFLGYFAGIGTLAGGIYYFAYPQKPTVPREFPSGLVTELGGPRAMAAPEE